MALFFGGEGGEVGEVGGAKARFFLPQGDNFPCPSFVDLWGLALCIVQ